MTSVSHWRERRGIGVKKNIRKTCEGREEKGVGEEKKRERGSCVGAFFVPLSRFLLMTFWRSIRSPIKLNI